MIYLYTYFSRKTFCYSKTQTWNNAKVTWVINLCMDMEERDSCALYMFGHNYKEIHIFPYMVLLIYIEGDSFVFFFLIQYILTEVNPPSVSPSSLTTSLQICSSSGSHQKQSRSSNNINQTWQNNLQWD